MQYLGNLTEDQTIDLKFSTHTSAGTPITLAGTPAISVYKANGTTESTAGVTLTVDFDSRTGCHHVRIDTSADAFYAVANDYQVVITTGTVDSISVVGTVLATFSIENRFIEADVVKIGGDAQSATDLKDFADAGYDPATNKVQGVVLTDTLTTYTGNTVQTGDSYAIVNSGTHGNAAIKGFVDDIGTAGAGLTAIPWNASWDAEVQSEVDDALVAQRLDELLNADSDIDGAAPPTVGSVFHELLTKTAGSFTYDQTTDSLEALRDRGDAAWITATSVAVGTGGITSASFAASAIDAAALAADAGTELADALLKRDMSAVTGESARSPLNALRFLRNKWTIASGTLSVKKEDDATEAWTAAVTGTSGADPVTAVDPA